MSFGDIGDVNRFLELSLEREQAQAEAELAYVKTGKAPLPPEEKWRKWPCDVCAKPVGSTGHLSVTTATEPKCLFWKLQCDHCESVLGGL